MFYQTSIVSSFKLIFGFYFRDGCLGGLYERCCCLFQLLIGTTHRIVGVFHTGFVGVFHTGFVGVFHTGLLVSFIQGLLVVYQISIVSSFKLIFGFYFRDGCLGGLYEVDHSVLDHPMPWGLPSHHASP